MNCFQFEFNRLSWAEAIQLNQYFESREIFFSFRSFKTKQKNGINWSLMISKHDS